MTEYHRRVSRSVVQGTDRVEVARATIAVGVALVVGALAAVGVQGEFLPRAVREAPNPLGVSFALVVLGLLLPFAHSKAGRIATILSLGGLALVISGTWYALWVGIGTIRTRETPAVTLTIAPIPGSTTSVQMTAEASGTSLSPAESAMLRVVAVRAGSEANAREICEHSQTNPFDKNENGPKSDVLSWGTSGPDVTGKVTLKSSLAVSALEYQYLCARVALRSRNQVDHADNRWAWVVVDLEQQRHVLSPPSRAQLSEE